MNARDFRHALALIFGRQPLQLAALHFAVHVNTVDLWRKKGPPHHVDLEMRSLLQLKANDIFELLEDLRERPALLPIEGVSGI